ncbi:nuclear transport factor 2 family protein [candidate division KSB1 bacterium]
MIVKQILKIVLISILLYSVIITLRHPHKEYYDAKDVSIYSNGNAPDSVRSEIIEQLHKFQDGYIDRNPSQLKPFMEQLFSQENLLVLGTMPNEIRIGQDKVSGLVLSDWESWGDCTFLVNNAHISTSGNVAWISTIGYVEFDMSRFLILPLRLSGVMVKENLSWKFQYMQFQFDMDFTFLLVTLILLMIWLLVSLISLIVMILKRLSKSNTKDPEVLLR